MATTEQIFKATVKIAADQLSMQFSQSVTKASVYSAHKTIDEIVNQIIEANDKVAARIMSEAIGSILKTLATMRNEIQTRIQTEIIRQNFENKTLPRWFDALLDYEETKRWADVIEQGKFDDSIADKMAYTWVSVLSDRTCNTCMIRHGQTWEYAIWRDKIGLPRDGSTECDDNCQCALINAMLAGGLKELSKPLFTARGIIRNDDRYKTVTGLPIEIPKELRVLKHLDDRLLMTQQLPDGGVTSWIDEQSPEVKRFFYQLRKNLGKK